MLDAGGRTLDDCGQRAIPLISHERARPILLDWSESLGDTLDACPLPQAERWVYFSCAKGRAIKVGYTRHPNERPFTSWRDNNRMPPAWPVVLISDSGIWVERVVKRAARQFAKRTAGYPYVLAEIFSYRSPVLDLVRSLREAAEASFFRNEWIGASPFVMEIEVIKRRMRAA
jgi:hypothetical protein